jgi:hypothetical protein
MKKKQSLIPFKQNPSKQNPDSDVIESGIIGDLEYAIYKRGVIHIFNKEKTKIFKKDPDLFEDSLNTINFKDVINGEAARIPGSGDNDDLVFFSKDGIINVTLEERCNPLIKKLKEVISKARNQKGTV